MLTWNGLSLPILTDALPCVQTILGRKSLSCPYAAPLSMLYRVPIQLKIALIPHFPTVMNAQGIHLSFSYAIRAKAVVYSLTI